MAADQPGPCVFETCGPQQFFELLFNIAVRGTVSMFGRCEWCGRERTVAKDDFMRKDNERMLWLHYTGVSHDPEFRSRMGLIILWAQTNGIHVNAYWYSVAGLKAPRYPHW